MWIDFHNPILKINLNANWLSLGKPFETKCVLWASGWINRNNRCVPAYAQIYSSNFTLVTFSNVVTTIVRLLRNSAGVGAINNILMRLKGFIIHVNFWIIYSLCFIKTLNLALYLIGHKQTIYSAHDEINVRYYYKFNWNCKRTYCSEIILKPNIRSFEQL